ncbi:MAG: FG-GAP repeat protein [Deltaproteobacteria bacterium]|nr:FG-GAP repeat protein [Deltaproteobacteria bacterium]
MLGNGIYEDTNSNGSLDPREERTGGRGGDGGSVFAYAFDLDAAAHDPRLTSIELFLASYDDAFRIDINGTTVVPLSSGTPATFSPPIESPQLENENGLSRLRISITSYWVEFSGTQTPTSQTMTPGVASSSERPGRDRPGHLIYGHETTPPIFVDGQNTITIVNPDGPGTGGIEFQIRMRRGDLPYQKISDTQGGFADFGHANFNLALAALGDLDGDGVGDLAARGPRIVDDVREQGIWMLFLNADGTVKNHTVINNLEGGYDPSLGGLGNTLSALGDLDGDGITELATGENRDDDGGGDGRGAATILFLDTDGTVKSQQRISSTHGGFTGQIDDGDSFAIEVAFLGDLDGDGVPDMASGALGDDDGGTDRGAVWILFLHENGMVKSHQKISDTAGGFTGALDDHDFFGESMASLGDLDGDGTSDLAVSAPWDDDGGGGRGAVWILFLKPDGRVKSHQKISDTQGGFTGALDRFDYFGGSLSSLGDLDGDGVVDLAVGAAYDDDGGPERGAVWILHLNTDGTVRFHEKISNTRGAFTGTLDNDDRLGISVASLGDLSGDGVGDLAVNAWGDNDYGAGAVWILFLDRAFCSDGSLNGDEACDDGNLVDGDGCDHTCWIEVQDP